VAVSALRILVIALLIAGGNSLAAGKDIALVGHKSNQINALSMPELVKVCKGQTPRWPDGKPVTFISRNPASPDMKLILEKVYGLSKDEVADLIVTANHGRTNHPAIVVVNSDEELVHKVESTPGAVGLVDVYSITGGVAVMKIGGKLPLESGYPLHGN
jgi:ABC-type phosphate transport system substrate-binding protein